MAHDRLKHISIFKTGLGQAIVMNDTLGPIGPKSAWLVEHLEMALAAYTSSPEDQHEILHPIRNMPWETPDGLPLNTLKIRLTRINVIADALDASWFHDFPVTGDEIFVTSLSLVREEPTPR